MNFLDQARDELIESRWEDMGGMPDIRRIPGFDPRYGVTPTGTVFNISRATQLNDYDNNGYRQINIRNNKGKRVGVNIHRLVAAAWIKPIPKGMWVNHKDGDKSNNHVSNLAITTPSENHRHVFDKLGRKSGIEKNIARHEAVKVLSENGWSQYKIATALEVTQPLVSNMLKEWKNQQKKIRSN